MLNCKISISTCKLFIDKEEYTVFLPLHFPVVLFSERQDNIYPFHQFWKEMG